MPDESFAAYVDSIIDNITSNISTNCAKTEAISIGADGRPVVRAAALKPFIEPGVSALAQALTLQVNKTKAAAIDVGRLCSHLRLMLQLGDVAVRAQNATKALLAELDNKAY